MAADPGEAGRLGTYRAIRDPAKTPEPMGGPPPGPEISGSAARFVIQEHHARALHWDFRLERDGVLVSWAIPKGLPELPSTNHLAVHTEDHPLDYASFEGDIPRGEYGGGHVDLWDRGTYDLEKWTDREVMVVLHGERAQGRYVLFATGDRNWMIHRMDPPKEGFEAMPEQVSPMMAVSGSMPERDRDWAYEFNWDGERAIVYVDGGRIRAVSGAGADLSGAFPELRRVGEYLGSRSSILDGELVALDKSGRPSSTMLQTRLKLDSRREVARGAARIPVSYLVFDLLYLEGRTLLECTYDQRRDRLESLELAGESFATPASFRDHHGGDVLACALEGGLKGIIAKRRSSQYHPGQRTNDWIIVDGPGRDES